MRIQMDTFSAFARGEANRNKEMMVFDWEQVARLIKERGAKNASAGLRGDWEWTGGPILRGGVPVPKDETYTYLSSTWAVPELELDNDSIKIPCYKMEKELPGWGSDTYWPKEALDILNDK